LKQVADFKGRELVDRILALVERYRPLHVSLVGGEPLVRHREISTLLPHLESLGIHSQVVTSAVRPIPDDWRRIKNLSIVVSVDGLQPEHDERRKPATYERIEKHMQGHRVTIHCTVTRQMTRRPGYLGEFVEFWSAKDEVRRIWMSLYTPQRGEISNEVLTPHLRREVLDELSCLRDTMLKLNVPRGLLESFREPPASPAECIFARTTRAISADLSTPVTPCQLGGDPDCRQCGCMASAGALAIGRYRLPPFGPRLSRIFDVSFSVGRWVSLLR